MTPASPTDLRWRLVHLRIELAVLEARFDGALAAEAAALALDPLVDGDIGSRFEADLERLAAAIDRVWATLRATQQTLWRQTAPWSEQLRVEFGDQPPNEIARASIAEFIAAWHRLDYAFDSTLNPELTVSELIERAERAEILMYVALAQLDDATLAATLAEVTDVDHDGTRFAVTTLVAVRNCAAAQPNYTSS